MGNKDHDRLACVIHFLHPNPKPIEDPSKNWYTVSRDAVDRTKDMSLKVIRSGVDQDLIPEVSWQ